MVGKVECLMELLDQAAKNNKCYCLMYIIGSKLRTELLSLSFYS